MARQFHRRKPLEAMSQINVTPLIDLAFALLIIFMITTPLLEQKIDLQLPVESPKAQNQATDEEFRTIAIRRDGKLFWDNQPLSHAALDKSLARTANEANPPVISIRADAAIRYQKVIDVLDLIKKHQLSKISLETQTR